MTPRILSAAWFVVLASVTAPSYPAEPEFEVGLVTESRTYERDELRKGNTPAAAAQPVRVQIERVTEQERRAAILKTCDADRAINEALGTMHSIHALGELLTQDTVVDKVEWVMAIEASIAVHADAMRSFLDRPSGWAKRS
jgi:hypothetical protein